MRKDLRATDPTSYNKLSGQFASPPRPASLIPMLLEADWIWAEPGRKIRGGALWIVEGRIRAVLEGPRQRCEVAGSAGERIRLGPWLMMPGWINAHAHLDLTFLYGRTPRGADFGAWVRAVLEARAETTAESSAASVQEGLAWCLAGGATAVGDVAGGPGVAAATTPSNGAQPQRILLRELLDGGDPRRTPGQVSVLNELDGAARSWGLSPHGPHTCSPELLAACADRARRAGVPVQVHWAETRAEVDYLAGRSSAFEGLLPKVDEPTSGLQRLAAAELLGPRVSLVHGNFADPGDWARLARAGVTLVHCPGTHGFFERGATPVGAALEAGVAVALGTDSAASNDALDLPRELAQFLASHPEVDGDGALAAVTNHGARALGLGSTAGRLVAGARADVFAVELRDLGGVSAGATVLKAALSEPDRGRRVFLGGRPARPWGPPGSHPEDPGWGWSGAEIAERWRRRVASADG